MDGLSSYRIYLSNLITGKDQQITKIPRHTLYSLITLFTLNTALFLIVTVFGTKDEYMHYIGKLEYSFTWFHLILTVLIAPIVEELAFRLLLSRKKRHVLISSSMIYAFFISILALFIFKEEIENHLFLFSVVWLGIFIKGIIMLSVPFLHHRPISELLTTFIKSNFKVTYYGSGVLFGLIHVLAQSLYVHMSLPVLICLFLSYFFSGLIFNGARIALGMFYVIALHMAINVIALA